MRLPRKSSSPSSHKSNSSSSSSHKSKSKDKETEGVQSTHNVEPLDSSPSLSEHDNSETAEDEYNYFLLKGNT